VPISASAPPVINLEKDSEILHSATAVTEAIAQVAGAISFDYAQRDPVLLVVMNGGLWFAGQLMSHLRFPLQIDYCHVTRYRGTTGGGALAWLARPSLALCDREVVVIDDILDEGHTLQAIVDDVRSQGAASVKTAVLVEKHHSRKAYLGMRPDYCALSVPDRYVFGAGMDYQHYWRNLSEIRTLKQPAS